jgi:peptidoglycan/xylan/chitin deacetylase (PgdA/CDA1 family)
MPTSRSPAGRRKQRGGGLAAVSFFLYLAAAGAGLWVGVQAYAQYGGALPGERPAAAGAPDRSPEAPRPTQQRRTRDELPAAEEPAPDPTGEPSVLPAAEGDPQVAVRTAPAADFEVFPPVEIDRATSGRPEVALTFDAGADWRPAKQILDTLLAEGVKCTFFLTGEWVEENPKTTRRIAAESHEVANHSWDHADFTRLGDAAVRDQLRRTEAAIFAATGRTSRPYFRPPLGARDARVRRLVGEEGFLTIYWSLDSHDSVVRGITASQIRDRVLEKIEPGGIVLLHCGSRATADALPEILAGLRERGLSPVLLSRLLAK